MEHKDKQPSVAKGILPSSVLTPSDVHNLRRQLDDMSEFMRQAEIRKAGSALQLPRISHNLNELAKDNNLNLLHAEDRKVLLTFLDELKASAPVVHISFSSDPSGDLLEKIADWFRRNIHPQTLIQVGLQPSIAAGCVIRTQNKIFDFTLRKHFLEQRPTLIKRLDEIIKQTSATPKPEAS